MSDKAKEYVKKNINLWQPHINLKLNFISTLDGDIRISGKESNEGSWSLVGTQAKTHPIDKPTLHIDLIQTPDLLNQTIRHEFGHALGLEHEHQHPDHTINWDTKKLYAETGKVGLTRGETDKNFLTTLSLDTTTRSLYDPASIMHYKVPAGVTTDGREVTFNEGISEHDKRFITSLYPPAPVTIRR